MNPRISSRLIALIIATWWGSCFAGCASTPDYSQPLAPLADALIPIPPEEFPDLSGTYDDLESLRAALENSRSWIRLESSKPHFPIAGISHGRVAASLERLAQLLEQCRDGQSFAAAVAGEFQGYRSAGWNGRGGDSLFTAYYTPILDGRLQPNDTFRYPLYGRPPELESAPDGTVLGMRVSGRLIDTPSRRAIEEHRLLAGRGLELIYLASALDAYLAHVQGSAYVRLGDGSMRRFGYAGTNGREYTSLAKVLVAAGELDAKDSRLPAIRDFANHYPDSLIDYLWRNERFTFFTPIDHAPHGSLNVPVTPHRTLATDKQLFPRAAPVFVATTLSTGGTDERPFYQLMFDQDTGGGIRTAGRADVYVGVGETAGEMAGRTRSTGQFVYLFLREELVPHYLP